MKKTTYIILAVIVGMFIAITIVFIYFMRYYQSQENNELLMNQSLRTYEINEPFNSIVISLAPGVRFLNGNDNGSKFMGLEISKSQENAFAVSDSWQGIEWSVTDSVLNIDLPNPNGDEPALVYGKGIIINSQNDVKTIQLPRIPATIKDFTTDSMSVSTSADLDFANCHVSKLNVNYGRWFIIKATNSTVGTLNITGYNDFDILTPENGRFEIINWHALDDQGYYMNIEKANIGQLNWIPETEDASFTLNTSRPTNIKFPEK